ncbi:MAG: hypothetical protein HIU92_10490 [Proteobacteria bacterium]|nr:hypothetical protein [Pseudomonadota bacterium]
MPENAKPHPAAVLVNLGLVDVSIYNFDHGPSLTWMHVNSAFIFRKARHFLARMVAHAIRQQVRQHAETAALGPWPEALGSCNRRGGALASRRHRGKILLYHPSARPRRRAWQQAQQVISAAC